MGRARVPGYDWQRKSSIGRAWVRLEDQAYLGMIGGARVPLAEQGYDWQSKSPMGRERVGWQIKVPMIRSRFR